MTSNPIIRCYDPSDHDGVVGLWARVFPDEPPHNKSEDVIARKLRVQPELFFVAIQDGMLVGTVLAGYDGVRGWVHKLAVCPDHRRKGLASALMHRAEQGLIDAGCPKLNLQVRADNREVLKFYQAHGYAVEDRASLGKPLT